MICAGDEIGRTQRGNNNAYCKDDETSWLDWTPLLDPSPEAAADPRRTLFEFTRRLIAVRRAHPALSRSKFFKGRRIRGLDVHDIMWLRHDGEGMTDADWGSPHTLSLSMVLAGLGVDDVDDQGEPVVDDDLVLMINGGGEGLEFKLPDMGRGSRWELLVATSDDQAQEAVDPGGSTQLAGRELKLFRLPREEAPR
jgi:isoamylase